MKRLFLLLFLCGIAPLHAKMPLRIVTSFSILKDLVQEVGGEHVAVASIVGPNEDAHVFEPTPETGKQLLRADMIVLNGLDFEPWAQRLIEASAVTGTVLVASFGVTPLHASLPSSANSVPDPHAWHDVSKVRQYVINIQAALVTKDPKNTTYYNKRAHNYLLQLDKLDTWIIQQFQNIPEEKRRIITAHDAFQYFARAYKVQVFAPQGVSTQSEPSAWDLSKLVDQIKKLKIHILFVENIANTKIMDQLSQETGAKIGGILYSDALSRPHEKASTYLKLMHHNVGLLASAMMQNGD